MDCFGMKENGKCTVLGGEVCEGTSCGFYKSKEEQEKSLEKANTRLRSLPEYQQEIIAERYHVGKRAW